MKIERMLSIIMLLLDRKTISAQELADIFEVSARTIYRDVDAINLAGIPIVTYPGPTGGIGIMEKYRVDKRLFTTNDLTSLLTGLSGIHSVISDSAIKSTLAKIQGLVPKEQISEIEKHTKQFAIDLTPWLHDSRQNEYLNLIKRAVAEKQLLILEYLSANGETSMREVEPYRLLHKGNGWYLQGYCLLRNELRTFRLYRIDRLELANKTFELRQIDFESMEENFAATTPQIKVTIRFHESAKKHIIGFWGDSIIQSFGDGYYTAQVTVMDNKNGYQSIFLMGDSCECLAPSKVRDYMKEMSASIASLYIDK